MIDAPYKLEDKTGYPLFWIPNPLKEESVQAQEESLLQRLFLGDRQIRNLVMSREEVLVHYSIQDFTSVDDFVKKVGKMTRTFGKGGMIDTQKVRVKILTDWFVGKLNHLMVVQ